MPAWAAGIWGVAAGARARLYAGGLLSQKRLHSKVVSIGNLAWGGTGKTPFTIWLAGRLQSAGLKVSILTRGYGRTSRERVKVLAPGTPAASAAEDGDEVQLYLRHLSSVPIGIGSSRYEAGLLIERDGPVDVHLLDDGFQHLQLARAIDFVLLDASDPWGRRAGGASLLREPASSLHRASAVILTHADYLSGPELAEAEGAAKAENASGESPFLREIQVYSGGHSPVFLARTRLIHFEGSGEASCGIAGMRERAPLAFAGLGNPSQFFAMLRRASIRTAAERAYPDHHRYSAGELAAIEDLARRAGANCLLTTEKDLMNLPAEYSRRLPLYWAATETVVEDEATLLEWIMRKLNLALGQSPPLPASIHSYAKNAAS